MADDSFQKIIDFRKATKALEGVMGRLRFYDQWGGLVVDSANWDADGNVLDLPWHPAVNRLIDAMRISYARLDAETPT